MELRVDGRTDRLQQPGNLEHNTVDKPRSLYDLLPPIAYVVGLHVKRNIYLH